MRQLAVLALALLQNSNAQLISPTEPVCPGNRVIFTCQQPGRFTRWKITLPSGTIETVAEYSQYGSINFTADPGFNFEIHINSSTVTTELQVTAVRELNGVAVNCGGSCGNFMSIIQVASVDPPAVPSGVMATTKQFRKTGASVNVTWSTSRGTDNYTVNVTPPIMPGQSSDFTTTDTSLLLMQLVYNVNYTINITAKNCAGSNSTILLLNIAGCSPPSSPNNGRINEYHNGSVGASLTFRCYTGYIPHEQVTSTCMENGTWVPVPQCMLADCGSPIVSSDRGVVIEPFNNTLFDATIVFYCEEDLIPDTVIEAVCGSTGVWSPNPANHLCVNQSSAYCNASSVPTGAHISNQSTGVYLEGTKVTFQCDNVSHTELTTVCHDDGSWRPPPSELDCTTSTHRLGSSSAPVIIGISLSVLFPFIILILILMIIGIVLKMKRSGVKSKPLRDLDTSPDGVAYSETRHPGPRGHQNQVQVCEEYSVISRPATTGGGSKINNTSSGQDGHTLIYADLGPSSSKRSMKLPALSIRTEDRVIYSALNHAASVQQPKVKNEPEHNKLDPSLIDSTLDLDSLLIQLKPQVTQKWKEFANVVGLSNMIKELSRYGAEECIVEVCDQWLKSHPTNPTWKDVANVVKEIGLHQLADGLLMAYNTGELPISVDMDALPNGLLADDNEMPPPLPPKITEDDPLPERTAEREFNSMRAPPKVPARPPRS